MDVDTFLTELYVLVDEWYKATIGKHQHVGAPERLSDSEVLTVAIAGQWRVGQLALGTGYSALDADAWTGLVSEYARAECV